MKPVVALLLIAFCVAGSNAAAKVYLLSGGQKIKLPVAGSGGVPAESALCKIEVAGLLFDMHGKGSTLHWNFSLQFKHNQPAPVKIRIEDVSEPDPLILIEDEHLTLSSGFWKGDASPVEISKGRAPWFFDGKNTERIFRITITVDGYPDDILYQVSVIPAESKAMILDVLKRGGG